MKNSGISIIIPCYNVEKYIEKCLDSILQQQLEKYQIILIDDCSKDNTVKVIENYQKKYKNIDIILLKNQENKGAGYSRNRAIEKSKYDIISFIDSDDYIENNFYQELLKSMIQEKSEISVCDIYVKSKEESYRSSALEGQNEKINYINNGLAASPCNKLIKKELLLKFPFAEGIMNEDIPTIIACLVHAKKISYTDNTYYNYIQHHSSVQNKKFSEKRFDIFKAIDLLQKRIKNCAGYKKIWEAVIYQQIIMFFIYVIPKEKNCWKRAKYLKKFYKLSKNFKIRENRLLWNFIDVQGTKHKFYYKMILKLNDTGFSYTTSFMITIYNILKKIISHPVIKKNITLQNLVKEAKKQSKKHSENSVSVIIPNYNYEKFLLQRIYSVLYQTYKINEIIILDDCSTDKSVKLINEIEKSISSYIKIEKILNEKNSNCVFKQWEKGFNRASSDYIWIAEADDYCEKKFLESNMKQIEKDSNIVLSYCDTTFIDTNGRIITKSVKSEIDLLKTKHWDQSYIIDGKEEIKKYSYLNCTIANVSSVIIKNGNYKEVFQAAKKYKQVGDWRFYLGIYEKGKISFVNKSLNYYRIHGSNVTSTTKKKAHFDEIKKLHSELNQKHKFNKEQQKNIKNRYQVLINAWHIKN